MSENRARFPMAAMCRAIGISESGFYAWAKREPSARSRGDAALIERIGAFHAASHGTYGAPRIRVDLRHAGLRVSQKRIARLMRVAGLVGVSRRRFIVTTTRESARSR